MVATLDLGTLGAAKTSLGRYARDATGKVTSVTDALDLLASARVLAKEMPLGPGERQALMLLLSKYEVPERLREHILELDVSDWTLDLVRELFPSGGRGARTVVSMLAGLASFEGLREDSRARVMDLSREMGVSPGLSKVLVEEAQLMVSATLRGDQPTLRRLRDLRAAILELSAP